MLEPMEPLAQPTLVGFTACQAWREALYPRFSYLMQLRGYYELRYSHEIKLFSALQGAMTLSKTTQWGTRGWLRG